MKKDKLKTLVLGLGNPILSDDSAGCRVAMALQDKLHMPDIDVREASIAGLDFLDALAGYDRTIIIDAIQTAKGVPGQIYRFGPEILANTRHAATPHDVNLATALELGKKLKLDLPRDITIFAIEAEDVTTFSDECTPGVEQAISQCVEMVIQELQIAS
ncbi:MAG: hydrogenase maturation protease [Dehalococcoidales bacterium]